MTAFHRTIVPLLCLVVAATTASPCAAKPRREQIIAFAERCKNEKQRMDLVAEFGVDFAGLNLSGVDFRGYHAVGYETNLRSANFSNCNLHRAEFGAAILDVADFTGANLDRATFVTASLKHATLLRVNLKGTQFYQTDLSGAKLTRADLSAADITGSNFGGADLSDATLSGAKNDYWWNDFSNANLTRANMSGLKLNGAGFQGAVLRTAKLSGTQLIQADFTGADLTQASFKHADVESAVFRNAQGLSELQRDQLEGRAQRWKFELKTGVASFLKAIHFPAYALVVLALAGLSFRALRLPDRPRSVTVAAVVNLLTFVPAFVLFGMCLLGASPTVQFNVRSSAAMELWSAWVGLWPLFMLALLSCLVVAVVTALVFLASHWRWTALKRAKLALLYIALTVVHCLFATHWVGSNFPSA
jgi:uncharacterized protein YjbI with pentapeptide repeats